MNKLKFKTSKHTKGGMSSILNQKSQKFKLLGENPRTDFYFYSISNIPISCNRTWGLEASIWYKPEWNLNVQFKRKPSIIIC